MYISMLMLIGGWLLIVGYAYVVLLLLVDDSFSDMPPWVALVWPVILLPVYAWLLFSRWAGRQP